MGQPQFRGDAKGGPARGDSSYSYEGDPYSGWWWGGGSVSYDSSDQAAAAAEAAYQAWLNNVWKPAHRWWQGTAFMIPRRTMGITCWSSCSLYAGQRQALTNGDVVNIVGLLAPETKAPAVVGELGEAAGSVSKIIEEITQGATVTSDTAKLTAKMANIRELGQTGEALAGIAKNTERIDSITGAAYRVPDILDKDLKIVGDVKNFTTTRLSLTRQLQDELNFAQTHTGWRMVLKVPVGFDNFSKPLRVLIDNGTIEIIRFPPQ